MNFRSDINGLRAISVLIIISFHYGLFFVTGGFIGVDVFFVISGFLMTRIILNGLDRGQFSLLSFYGSRVARIIPPLVAMCFCWLLLGIFLLDVDRFKALAQETIAALTFSSNVVYWRQTGYFDAQSESKWLLNTWSLAVEWQFYLIYPIVIGFLYRIQRLRENISWCIAIMLAISLGLSLLVAGFTASAAFYLLPTRAWEMLAGGLVYCLLDRAGRVVPYPRVVETVGLTLIIGSALYVERQTNWPSLLVVVATLGAVCVIAAARSDAIWATNPVAKVIGGWSYSLYLWHWPLMVYLNYMNISDKTARIGVLSGCFAAAFLGEFIQGAVGKWRGSSFQKGRLSARAWVPLAASLVVILASGAVILSNGFEMRQPNRIAAIHKYQAAMADWHFPPNCDGFDHWHEMRACTIGTGPDRTLVLGDSHAEQLYARFQEYAALGHQITFATFSACAPLPGVKFSLTNRPCDLFADKGLALAQSGGFQRVIITAMWDGYLANPDDIGRREQTCFVTGAKCQVETDFGAYEKRLDAVFANLTERLMAIHREGTAIIIIGSTPHSSVDLPRELLRRNFLGMETANPADSLERNAFAKSLQGMTQRLQRVAAAVDGTFIDPAQTLCGPVVCPLLDPESRPLLIDSNHYTVKAVKSDRFAFLDGIFKDGTIAASGINAVR